MKAVTRFTTSIIALGGAIALGANVAHAALIQTDLVSDVPGLAIVTDPSLRNPWGVAESGTSPFWVSDQGTNVSTLYTVTGPTTVSKSALTVSIPTTASGAQGPTGQVFSGSTGNFLVGNGGNNSPASFIFANLNGTISAWNSGTAATVQATNPGAAYTGLAISTGKNRLFAANGAGNSIDVYNSSFQRLTLPGAFVDPNLPAGFVPFNVQDIGGKVYVTYAPAGHANQTGAVPGQGFVTEFDENGNLLSRLLSGGQLAAPWGLTIAPSGFGQFGGDLLVGNFSFQASEINAFDPASGALLGTIPLDIGSNTPGGLWALTFGNGGSGGDPNTLYFAEGINGEADGLFAAIVNVPEPPAAALLAMAIVSMAGWRAWRRS